VPATMQSTNLYDIYVMLYVQSWTPYDGWKDRPKHVELYSINSKNCASSWFYYRKYHDARSYKLQIKFKFSVTTLSTIYNTGLTTSV
jgi:hypothetical protein